MTREEILNMPAGREMDTLVAENVLNLPPCDKWTIQRHYPIEMINDNTCEHHGKCYPKEKPCFYSTNIAAAWEILEKLHPAYSILLDYDDPETVEDLKWDCSLFAKDEPYNTFEARSNSAPLAICRAALLAVIEAETA